MKQRFIIICVMLTVFMAPLWAEVSLLFDFESGGKGHSGYTTYDLEHKDNGFGVFSRLEFPLDAYMIGGSARITLLDGVKEDLYIEGQCYINATNPELAMKDHDWVQPVEELPKLKFSYTESTAIAQTLLLDVKIGKNIESNSVMDAFVIGGYQLEHSDQQIYNAHGWWLDLAGELDSNDSYIPPSFDVTNTSFSGAALTYSVTYHTLQAGGGTVFRLFDEKLKIKAEVLFLLSFAVDTDDHILRNKRSQGACVGAGGAFSFETSYRFNDKAAAGSPYISLTGDIMEIKLNGKETQTWYGNDDASPNFDDTGAQIKDITHKISTSQYSLGLFLGYQFSL